MNDSLRVTIDSAHFADPSLKIRLAVLLEKAVKEEFAKHPHAMREASSVEINVEGAENEQMLRTTRQIISNTDLIDERPLHVEIHVE